MGVDIARVSFARKEYRVVSSEDTDIKTQHPLAVEVEFNTLISEQSDASDFGDMVLSLRKENRYSWETVLNISNYPDLKIGDTITIVYPRFGLDNGKNFIVKRLRKDTQFPLADLSLFGPE